jgi:hypothetical protein
VAGAFERRWFDPQQGQHKHCAMIHDNPSLKALASEYGDQLNYVASRAKEQLGLGGLLVRRDGFVAWASDSESSEQSTRQAAALWFTRKETL